MYLYLILETINCLLISFIHILHSIWNSVLRFSFSDLSFGFYIKSSIYFEILSNPQISLIFLRISSLYIVKSLDLFFHSLIFCSIKGIFGFSIVSIFKMVILVF